VNRLRIVILFISVLLCVPNVSAYSVLTHESIIDSLWDESLVKLLRQRFPGATAEDLRKAHAFAYGGSIIQDMGYYPFGSRFFTDLVHYVRSGDFVDAMVRDSKDTNEYAFALGALAHYAADNNGHPLAINRAVPLLYPKLARKYGSEVTYADDPAAHLKTEFGFDVVQVARGRYASDAYRDFIGFEVSKPLLERAFQDTYGLELKDVFGALDLAMGSYRRSVSSIIPKMTQVAWEIKKDEIQKNFPGITREKFLYSLSRAAYEKEWGTNYRHPGIGTQLLAFVVRVIPKVGPFRALRFRTPTPESEKLFLESVNATILKYRELLAAEASRHPELPNANLDIGRPASYGTYPGSDETYARLVDKLARKHFDQMPSELREDILAFYGDRHDVDPKIRLQLLSLTAAK
jgi:zinc dependent phospholipase C